MRYDIYIYMSLGFKRLNRKVLRSILKAKSIIGVFVRNTESESDASIGLCKVIGYFKCQTLAGLTSSL